jgi:hypothetical protein
MDFTAPYAVSLGRIDALAGSHALAGRVVVLTDARFGVAGAYARQKVPHTRLHAHPADSCLAAFGNAFLEKKLR